MPYGTVFTIGLVAAIRGLLGHTLFPLCGEWNDAMRFFSEMVRANNSGKGAIVEVAKSISDKGKLQYKVIAKNETMARPTTEVEMRKFAQHPDTKTPKTDKQVAVTTEDGGRASDLFRISSENIVGYALQAGIVAPSAKKEEKKSKSKGKETTEELANDLNAERNGVPETATV